MVVAESGGVSRNDDTSFPLPVGLTGRPHVDGPRRRGAVSFPRSPLVRIRLGAADGFSAPRLAREGNSSPVGSSNPADAYQGETEATLPGARCAELFRTWLSGLDPGAAKSRSPSPRGNFFTRSRTGSRPPLQCGSRNRLSREPGNHGRPLHSALASTIPGAGGHHRTALGQECVGHPYRGRSRALLIHKPIPHPMYNSESEIISRVRYFVQENFLYMHTSFQLGDDDRLLEKGVMDSMSIVEMISFIESEFGVQALEDEISEENFGSLSGIARFVGGKKLLRAS